MDIWESFGLRRSRKKVFDLPAGVTYLELPLNRYTRSRLAGVTILNAHPAVVLAAPLVGAPLALGDAALASSRQHDRVTSSSVAAKDS